MNIKSILIISILFFGTVGALATPELYEKDGASFKPVTKKQATIDLLMNRGQIFKCQEQEITDKVTIRTKVKDESK